MAHRQLAMSHRHGCAQGIVIACWALGCSGMTPSSAVTPAAESLVAEAVIARGSTGTVASDGLIGKYVFLPITLQGQPVSVQLDLGAPGGLFAAMIAMTHLDMGFPIADVVQRDDGNRYLSNLPIGTMVERDVRLVEVGAMDVEGPAGLPEVGIVGTSVLSHYDLLFDGPAGRVRLYYPSSHPTTSPAVRSARWLPPGIALADCLPMVVDTSMGPNGVPANTVLFPVHVNGHVFYSLFDSGSESSNMNLAAARLLGVPPSSSAVHRFMGRAFLMGDSARWEATNVLIAVGTRPLPPTAIRIYEHIPVEKGPDDPVLNLGLAAFQDRILFVSYSTRTVCVSVPQRFGRAVLSPRRDHALYPS